MPQIKSGGGLLFYPYLSQKIIYREQPLAHRLGRAGAHRDKKPRKREVPGLLKEFISNSFIRLFQTVSGISPSIPLCG